MAKEFDNNIKRLQRVLDVFSGDPLTRAEMQDELKTVAQYFVEFQKQYFEKMATIQKLLDKETRRMSGDNAKQHVVNKKEIDRLVGELKTERAKLLKEIQARVSLLRDGKDADEEAVVERAAQRVKEELFIPSAEDILNDVPMLAARIRDSLELLKDDERLDVSAIKGIEELLRKIDGKIKKAVGAIHVPSPTGWTRHQSFPCDGATTVFSLDDAPAHGGKAAIVRLEGQVLTETTHYSISGTDITTTFTPDDGSQIDVTYWPF